LYVSTAYSNCVQEGEIKEKFYEPPMTAAQLFDSLEAMDDQMVQTNLGR
jgi:hypothetical protein